ncbi:Txe/YoeB family addiction module toxin [Loigolactobacillus coryniformis]|uniref:Endoribonuclease YoeB n=1 Tax=Loigolactobacillus coryniformis subsp. torquens DSM 20004 = KCTC 3535 TaxID=1423822 RepID=A0A2D1KR44_9LACO|nr:Txe/YoeB family addiction module toxin [Loigolactobacillus coryniformis]ATO44561.1 Txe/YoeB family addiction module toxin [Loigolactobacillus coryniformis subsp. torquens DSM 20004 = KCTC 3535]KRK79542.1 addiction module toxin, Txe YoeB family protein [Loigolactobacillus coryniformis subsp. torquens DSM 20004 = KCTC 3535]MDN5952956.1 Txe/YoeB family addiction module toxin [Loigolactobacillus coryniformis]
MIKSWYDVAWRDYVEWQNQDRKTLKKINNLLKEIERHGVTGGSGKAEKLKSDYSGWYSRRIDAKNRLVYKIERDTLLIASCKTHYGDK